MKANTDAKTGGGEWGKAGLKGKRRERRREEGGGSPRHSNLGMKQADRNLEVETVCKLCRGICGPGTMCSDPLNCTISYSSAPAPVETPWSAGSW